MGDAGGEHGTSGGGFGRAALLLENRPATEGGYDNNRDEGGAPRPQERTPRQRTIPPKVVPPWRGRKGQTSSEGVAVAGRKRDVAARSRCKISLEEFVVAGRKRGVVSANVVSGRKRSVAWGVAVSAWGVAVSGRKRSVA